MAISPTDELLAKYKRDYHADDLDEVLGNIQKYGTDDRSAWYPPEKQAAPLPPSWDRTAFRDAWMGSGVQNVQDMQNWLSSSGWGSQVGTGGSKGDLMYLPSGEIMDTVLAAGLGGNRGGPQWTGRGSWSGGYTPFDQQQQGPQKQTWGGAPTWSQQNYQTMTSGGGGWGGQGQQASSGPGSSMYDDYMKIKNDQSTQGQNAAKQQQMGMHRQFQSGQRQKQQPNYYQSQQGRGWQQSVRQNSGGGIGGGQQQQPKYW